MTPYRRLNRESFESQADPITFLTSKSSLLLLISHFSIIVFNSSAASVGSTMLTLSPVPSSKPAR